MLCRRFQSPFPGTSHFLKFRVLGVFSSCSVPVASPIIYAFLSETQAVDDFFPPHRTRPPVTIDFSSWTRVFYRFFFTRTFPFLICRLFFFLLIDISHCGVCGVLALLFPCWLFILNVHVFSFFPFFLSLLRIPALWSVGCWSVVRCIQISAVTT